MFYALRRETVETVNRPTQRRRKALRAAGRVVLENLELRQLLSVVLDNSFGGGDGVASASFQPFFDQPLDGQPMNILPAADGDIVLGGRLEPNNAGDQQAGVARFNSDGSLDTTFDGDGTVEEYIPPHSV